MELSTTGSIDSGASLIARLEADLMAGNYRPGEWLKQADIEAAYDANRFDVRMALLELKARQLIEHVRNRGFRVVNLSDRECEELIETRVILESAAIRMAAERATKQDIEVLDSLVREFNETMQTADVNALRLLNARFHDRLYETCGNAVLAKEIKALRQRGLPGSRGSLSWRTMAGISRSNDDHREMVRLLEARDGDALAEVVRRHLNHWREHSKPAAQMSGAAA